MKHLRQYIRKTLKETIQDPSASFENELYKTFENLGQGILTNKYPDGCEVRFKVEPIGGVDVYIHTIETVGGDCLRKGYARDTMKTISSIADSYYIFLTLEAIPFSRGYNLPDENALISFYESLGFKVTNGNEMERPPKM